MRLDQIWTCDTESPLSTDEFNPEIIEIEALINVDPGQTKR